jgi:hypothetical protein
MPKTRCTAYATCRRAERCPHARPHESATMCSTMRCPLEGEGNYCKPVEEVERCNRYLNAVQIA